MHAVQFPAVNPPPEISAAAALIGRTKRPHCVGVFPNTLWFVIPAEADRSSQPYFVGLGTLLRMLDCMCGDSPNQRNHNVSKEIHCP